MNKNVYNVLGIEHKTYTFADGTAENYALHLCTLANKDDDSAYGVMTFVEKIYSPVIDSLGLSTLSEICGKDVKLYYGRNGRVIKIEIL